MIDTESYENGFNELSKEEIILCDVYACRGRSDLAECVKNGRIYQRLRDLIGQSNVISSPKSRLHSALVGLAGAMTRQNPSTLPYSLHEWESIALGGVIEMSPI